MLDKNKFLSLQEQKQLLSYWRGQASLGGKRSTKTYAFISFAIGSGFRASEIAGTRLDDLQLSGEYPSVEVLTKKNGEWSTVYISLKLAKLLKRYVSQNGHSEYLFPSESGAKQTTTGLYLMWRTALRRAGLPKFPLHSSRHSFACNIYRKSKDLRMTQKQLRHRSIQSTMIYADVTVEDVCRVMDSI